MLRGGIGVAHLDLLPKKNPYGVFRALPLRWKTMPTLSSTLARPDPDPGKLETTSFPGLFHFELGRPNSKWKSPGNEVELEIPRFLPEDVHHLPQRWRAHIMRQTSFVFHNG